MADTVDPRARSISERPLDQVIEPQFKVDEESSLKLSAIGFKYEDILRRFEVMKAERSAFTSHWQEIAEVVAPRQASFFTDEGSGYSHGSTLRKHKQLYDTTGAHANELLSSGFFSLLTSPTQPWFMLSTNNNELNRRYEIASWLDEVSRILAYEMQRPQTGFTTSMHEFYLEYGAYGNGTIFNSWSVKGEHLTYNALPLSECYYGENDESRVDTLIRHYWRTPYQLVDRYGEEGVHENVLQAYLNPSTGRRFEIIHAILPNTQAEAFALFSDELPYISVYIDKENKDVLSISGFHEQPFMAARFYKMPQDVYGCGPGSIALPDLNMLQEIVRTVLRGAQKMVDPPIMMPDQGFLSPPNTAPGRVNYFRAGSPETDRMFPLQTGGHPEIGMDLIQSVQNRIREIFFVDQLQLNIGPQMTATEVMQRTEEKQRLMGPIIGRASTELLSPLIRRSFGLLYRNGKLPEPPQSLLEQPAQFKIIYTSPIFKAQEQVAANNLTRAQQVLLPFISADPSILQSFHPQRTTAMVGEMFNLSKKMFRTEEEMQQLQMQQQQQMAAQEQAQQLKDQGIGIRNLAQAGATLQGM